MLNEVELLVAGGCPEVLAIVGGLLEKFVVKRFVSGLETKSFNKLAKEMKLYPGFFNFCISVGVFLFWERLQ